MPKKKPPGETIKPLEKAPAVPAGLKGDYARKYWKRITEELVKVRAITVLHLEAIEALCRQWQDFRQLSDWIDKHPDQLILEYESGHMVEHPRVRLRQTAFANLCKLWPAFGLTPHGQIKIGKGTTGKPAARGSSIGSFAAGKYRN